MAERRMFAKTIIDSDAFLDMPATSQLLYFHLAMRADDDGFVNSPKKILRVTGCGEDDLKLLFVKKFLIPFESGVVVIKHWKIHNYIRKDTYHETKYKEEKCLLELDENEAYRIAETPKKIPCNEAVTNTLQTCIQDVHKPSTQVRIGKDRLVKDSIEEGYSYYYKGTDVVVDDFTLIKMFVDNFGRQPSKFEIDRTIWMFTAYDRELVEDAFEVAAQQDKKNIAYVMGILNKQKEAGISNMEDLARYNMKKGRV